MRHTVCMTLELQMVSTQHELIINVYHNVKDTPTEKQSCSVSSYRKQSHIL